MADGTGDKEVWALVESGGGAKGRYQLGACRRLFGELGIRYHIRTGVSVGALNASYKAMFPDGKEREAYEGLKAMWDKIDDAAVFKKWAFWGEMAALWKPSLYDSTPLQKLVRSQLDPAKIRAAGHELRVGAVSLETGEYRVFDQHYTDLPGAVLASAAFPAMLTPVKLGNQLWTDGGVRTVTPIKAAIDLGATNIDVILCAPESAEALRFDNPTTLKIAERSIDLMSDQIIADDLAVVENVNRTLLTLRRAREGGVLVPLPWAGSKRVIHVRVIRPDHVLLHNSLDFDPVKGADLERCGYEDACRVVG